jgi:hypothetical protein
MRLFKTIQQNLPYFQSSSPSASGGSLLSASEKRSKKAQSAALRDAWIKVINAASEIKGTQAVGTFSFIHIFAK